MSWKGRAVIPIIIEQTRPSWQHDNGQVASISLLPVQQLDQLKLKYNVFSSILRTRLWKPNNITKHFPCYNRNRERKIKCSIILNHQRMTSCRYRTLLFY
jgi:hypothetical protein